MSEESETLKDRVIAAETRLRVSDEWVAFAGPRLLALEADAAAAWHWVEFGRRLVHEQATRILTLEWRIASQSHALRIQQERYLLKLDQLGISRAYHRVLKLYTMVRKHNRELAAERNFAIARVAAMESFLGVAMDVRDCLALHASIPDDRLPLVNDALERFAASLEQVRLTNGASGR